MVVVTAEWALQALGQTPVVLGAVLRGVTPERAREATDGPDGWSVVAVICHLRDYEEIFHQRATLILADDRPSLPTPNQDELARERDYASEDLGAAVAAFGANRRRFLDLLAGVTDEQWSRRGVHPRQGELALVEMATRVPLHDVNHIEQIVRALGEAG